MHPSRRQKVQAGDENAFYGQFVWKEILVDPNDLTSFAVEENVDPYEKAALKEAREQIQLKLLKRIYTLVSQYFTEHQKRVFGLWMRGYTYQKIGAILAENYSCAYSAYTSISHTIKGIRSKKHDTYHGGIEKKLRKLCSKDEESQDLISKFRNLNSDNPIEAMEYLSTFDPFWKDHLQSLSEI